MIKKFLTVSVFVIVFFSCSFLSFAAEGTELSGEITDKVKDSLFSALNEETIEILEKLGLDDMSSDSVFDLSFSDILTHIKNELSLSIKENLHMFMKLIALLMIMICASSFESTQAAQTSVYADVFTLLCIIFVSVSIKDNISITLSVLKVTGGFMTAYIPVLAAILAISGNVTSSVLYSSGAAAIAEIISVLSQSLLIPFVRIYFALTAAASLNPAIMGEKLSSAINKALLTVLSSAAVFLTFFLSVKNILASDIDSLAFKSGRYLISGLIPVIGTSIGSIFSSIIGSLNLVKSTVGIFVIICAFIINLPAILRLAICEAGLKLLGSVSDAFGEKNASGIFSGFAGGIKILLTLTIFELVLVIITTGLVVTVKGGG